MSLTSKPVDGLDLEGSALALWNEFLASFFDGATHDVGPMKSILFPAATLRFQESPQPKPLTNVGISVVWVQPSKVTKCWDTLTASERAALPAGTIPNYRQERARAYCAFIFLVRATGSTDNSQKQVQVAASRLYGLLANAGATKPLAEKGIRMIRPTPPRMAFPGDSAPTADLGYRLRVMSCAAVLRWPVVSQAYDGASAVIILSNGASGFVRVIVDLAGNVLTQTDPGPATADVILADANGGFWKLRANTAGLRVCQSDPGPATVAPVLLDANLAAWTLVVDTAGNVGATA